MTSIQAFIEFDKSKHDRKKFDCGSKELNGFLKSKAHEHRKLQISRTMVQLADEPTAGQLSTIQAYYTTAITTIERETLPPSPATKRIPPYPVPVYIIVCLAVATEFQGQGLGKSTLIKALESLYQASQHMPGFAVIIDPIDERAEELYRKYNFQDLGDNADSKRLFLPMSTLNDLFSEE